MKADAKKMTSSGFSNSRQQYCPQEYQKLPWTCENKDNRGLRIHQTKVVEIQIIFSGWFTSMLRLMELLSEDVKIALKELKSMSLEYKKTEKGQKIKSALRR